LATGATATPQCWAICPASLKHPLTTVSKLPRTLLPALSLALLLASPPLFAQEQKGQQPAQQQSDAKKIDEFAEAAAVLNGPAGNPECVWLGRRVVNLMWRDDLDTAFRHLDLYDRFTCPGGHVQATFRCVVRQGQIDPKAPDSLNARVHQCWMNPSLQPAATAAAPGNQPPAANPPTTGTNQ
jgi:hypothetical protein